MVTDEEGFKYPLVNQETCITCSRCINTCPQLKRYEPRSCTKAYAAVHTDESIQVRSSSGGFFTALSHYVLNKGGVVFGAKITADFQHVVHDYAEDIADLEKLRGSKYVQSDINTMYIKARSFLKEGRLVLFTGTPCQIAGLNEFLKKQYDNLITCDFICHGVPSPLIWSKYISTYKDVKKISFRDKSHGWKKYSLAIDTKKKKVVEPRKKNLYLKGFSKNLYLRPSCYSCQFKSGRSQSAITMGDYWGVEHSIPELSNSKGVSALIIHNEQVLPIIEQLDLKLIPSHFESIVKYNPSY